MINSDEIYDYDTIIIKYNDGIQDGDYFIELDDLKLLREEMEGYCGLIAVGQGNNGYIYADITEDIYSYLRANLCYYEIRENAVWETILDSEGTIVIDVWALPGIISCKVSLENFIHKYKPEYNLLFRELLAIGISEGHTVEEQKATLEEYGLL
ncbi:hypothetical protein [Trichococcus alkaliphilus]|uniref:hypothetical protein n=1 Tax=Trichococcus alkaliphilus TaxID=2052943 RepID=UPI000D0B8F00|nr:hypothetical protein [Trichococcus alkaliphilus]